MAKCVHTHAVYQQRRLGNLIEVIGCYLVVKDDPHFGYGDEREVVSARCLTCGQLLSLGPATDTGVSPEVDAAVAVEIRAAEMIQDIEGCSEDRKMTTAEGCGWFSAWGMHNCGDSGWESGWLARAYVEHDELQSHGALHALADKLEAENAELRAESAREFAEILVSETIADIFGPKDDA